MLPEQQSLLDPAASLNSGSAGRDNKQASARSIVPTVFRSLTPAKTTVVFDTYWRFATERQSIFFKRIDKQSPPWTDDPILLQHKFTNAYRASDRVSQYLIKNVIYAGEQTSEDIFFRVLLFKFFNHIETWELLTQSLGPITYRKFSFKTADELLSRAIDHGKTIYSAAYIMPSGGARCTSGRKHRMHLELLESMMRDMLPLKIERAVSLRQAFEILRRCPTLGDFLAYQYVIDLNYSPMLNFSEMDFVVPGPGARNGIQKCFSDLGGLNESDMIKVVTDRQQVEFDRLGLSFQSLWGRPLQLIDCQNLFCEVDKYARVKHPEILGLNARNRIKQNYRPNRPSPCPWYPPKWGLNDMILVGSENVPDIPRQHS